MRHRPLDVDADNPADGCTRNDARQSKNEPVRHQLRTNNAGPTVAMAFERTRTPASRPNVSSNHSPVQKESTVELCKLGKITIWRASAQWSAHQPHIYRTSTAHRPAINRTMPAHRPHSDSHIDRQIDCRIDPRKSAHDRGTQKQSSPG